MLNQCYFFIQCLVEFASEIIQALIFFFWKILTYKETYRSTDMGMSIFLVFWYLWLSKNWEISSKFFKISVHRITYNIPLLLVFLTLVRSSVSALTADTGICLFFFLVMLFHCFSSIAFLLFISLTSALVLIVSFPPLALVYFAHLFQFPKVRTFLFFNMYV